MKLAILIASVLLAQGALAGELKIDWVNPEKFTDIAVADQSPASALDIVSKEFVNIFRRLTKQLPEGYVLEVRVTDLNLAGQIKLNSRGERFRVINESDYPAISFDYTLMNVDKKVLESDGVDLVDSQFAQKRRMVSSPYVHEEQMLKAWFEGAILQKFDLGKK
ncbi:MAG: hypothetical protein RL748_3393 [Pseudomonadota bacterium]